VGERSYLAIGDVLALLREEFPDITISKIRFLESRGLLVPERTPSGYRKFYEPDVERLRWILRQQREHFLPLKVIKGRLENGMTDSDAPTPQLFEMGDPPPQRESQVMLVGAHGTAEATREASLQALAPVAAAASAGGRTPNRADSHVLASRETGPAAGRATGPSPRGSTHGTTPGARQPASGHRSPEPEEGAAGNAGPSRSRRPRSTRSESNAGSQNATTEPGPAPAGEPGDEGPNDAGGPARRATPRSTSGLPGAGLSGASLTLVELANASGLGVPGVEELESFGLIAGRTVAGVHCYDEEAVLVAKLAARFVPYGIEARHLKVFKHAADRQTGLFAQVVTPLLRQRNPEARARAIEDLAELAELGEALMRCFSQATLRELTGG
jgi:DNA-binding transcriptional MerR regulator